MKLIIKAQVILMVLFFSCHFSSVAQELYTAKGYWKELMQDTYQEILNKGAKGGIITIDESVYLDDYEAYLETYFSRLSDEEKVEFARMQEQWGKETENTTQANQLDFTLRAKDRLVNGIYGAYYGASIVAIAEVEGGGLAIGLPLIMAGVWQLGPVINRQKYEGISIATIRAGNSGKLLGVGYGAALGLAISGNSEDTYKWVLGLSSISSIALGEIAFQTQKKRNLTEGHVDVMRHYGFLGPIVSGLGALAINTENSNLIGASLLAGGVAGLFIGKGVASRYDYTAGDVDVISSLTLITGGLGATVAVDAVDSDASTGLLLIPAATAIAGTIFGQSSVHGVHVTKRQGSTIRLSSGGAALIGLGIVALTESDSPALYVGVASGLGLVMHQVLFQSYKKKNFENNFKSKKVEIGRVQFSMNVSPENYLVHKNMSEKRFMANPDLTYPIVNFKLAF